MRVSVGTIVEELGELKDVEVPEVSWRMPGISPPHTGVSPRHMRGTQGGSGCHHSVIGMSQCVVAMLSQGLKQWLSTWWEGGANQGSSGVCNAPECLRWMEPGSTPSQSSFKGWWWRWGHHFWRSLSTWGLYRSSAGRKFFFLPLISAPSAVVPEWIPAVAWYHAALPSCCPFCCVGRDPWGSWSPAPRDT